MTASHIHKMTSNWKRWSQTHQKHFFHVEKLLRKFHSNYFIHLLLRILFSVIFLDFSRNPTKSLWIHTYSYGFEVRKKTHRFYLLTEIFRTRIQNQKFSILTKCCRNDWFHEVRRLLTKSIEFSVLKMFTSCSLFQHFNCTYSFLIFFFRYLIFIGD